MLKLLSLFSGIGAFEKALTNIGEPFEVVNYCEIDKYASKAYSLIHNLDENMNLGDITTVDTKELPNDIDIITYGFPCQDISIAGKMSGFVNNEGEITRSGLFFQALRIIEDTQPKIAIAENVKNLTSKKFAEQFKIVLESLEGAGYTNYYKVLNAKDYGVPQNRERVFIVSIRKDIDHGKFMFPNAFPLKLRLKDVLECEVNHRFYLSDDQIGKLRLRSANALVYDQSMIGFENNSREYNEVMPTITAREWKEPRCVNETVLKQVGQIYGTEREPNPQAGRIYDSDGISPTLDSCSGGNRMPKVMETPSIQSIDIPQTVKVRKYEVNCELLCECLSDHKYTSKFSNKDIADKLNVSITKVEHWFRQDEYFAIPDAEIWLQLKNLLGIKTDAFDMSIMTFEEKEGTYEKSERHYFSEGIAPTLTCANSTEKVIEEALRIRKLTPKECFRLMGFDDADVDILVDNGISNTQLYKMAGNSIVVDVLEEIFVELLNQYEDVFPYDETERVAI